MYMTQRIAIQGYEGSFHHQAAKLYFGKNIEVMPCASFKTLVQQVQQNKHVHAGLMAIENSIAGSILANYTLLLKSKLNIIGEISMPIKQNLLAMPDVSIENIKEVHSHPMALLQCDTFLEQHKFKLVESEDTALSAKHIAQRKLMHTAAIASAAAAELYGLAIIAPAIQTAKDNYTRFLHVVPSQQAQVAENANKAAIYFTTNHSQGSLAKVLAAIANSGINLSKLQSMPIAGSKFQYGFYADMEFTNLQQYHKAIKKITACTNELKILGIYKN
jgi:prephenate dehydratase